MWLRRAVRSLLLLLLLGVCVLSLYGAKGYWDGRRDAGDLAARADALIANGQGAETMLGSQRLAWLIAVQDPGFFSHRGVDLRSPGAGITTITQSLAKRVAFEEFQPGLPKLRQTMYALALEQRLNKAQILALWLDTVEMGRGPDGWMTGFTNASEAIFGAPPSEIRDAEYLQMLAVLIAPGRLQLLSPSSELDQRVGRIERLLDGQCQADGLRDVWLDGCAAP